MQSLRSYGFVLIVFRSLRLAECGIDRNGEDFGYSQGAILSLKLNSGEIVSMVGGTGGINRTLAYRQPGSTFKIFNYIAALEKRIPLSRKFSCDSLTWGITYKYCERSNGATEISLRDGLISSENPISLRLAQKIGLKKIVRTADDLLMITSSHIGILVCLYEIESLEEEKNKNKLNTK